MNKSRSFSLPRTLHWGALEIAGIYLIIGALWILFSDQIAARVAVNEQMMQTIKGGAYVLITALLLYGLIQRHTARLLASEVQLQRVLDALPALISYIDKDQRYRFTNRAYQDWFGGEALGKHIQEVVGTPAYQSALKYIDKVLSGETVRYETEIVLSAGERFVSAIYVPDIGMNGQVEGFFTLVHDVTDQKQTLEERRLWADAFEGCAHGIAIGDPNTNRIVVCNPAFAKLHRCRVEDIVGSAILSLYAASDHEHVRRNVQKADQIGHACFEARMTRRCKDSSTFPVEMDVVSILGEDGEVLHRVVTAQDISERKQAQERLKESEAKYRTLVEHLPAITYVSGPEQYMGVSYISPQIESLGFDVDTWLAEPDFWFQHIHPEDQERVTSELQRFQDGGESFKAEYRLILPNGETRWFRDESIRMKDQDGKTILKQGFMLDITESKQAEKVLKESEERYRIVSELTSDYAYKDGVAADGTIVPEWVTDSFTRITGYTWKEAQVPELWTKLIYPEDASVLVEHTQKLLSGVSHIQEMRITTKSGDVRWLRDFANPIYDESQGRVVGLYGAVQDITEYRQAEEKLRLQARWLDQINDAVITSDPNLVISAWNPAAERVYGWKAEEVIGKKGEEVLRSEFFSKTRAQVLQELKGSGEFSAEITQLRKDGSRIHVETRTATLRDESGRAIGHLSVNRDITERKQAEQENASLARFPAENPNPVMRATHEGKIIYANAASEPLLQDWHAEVGDSLPADWIELIQGIIRTGTGKNIDITCGEKTYAIMIVYAPDANDVNIYGRDITERKRAEEALLRSEALLLQTSAMAKVGGWELDLQTVTLIWSREIYRIYEIDDFEQPNLEDAINYYTEDARPVVRAAVQQAIEDGQPFSFELPMITAKGRHIWVRAMGQAESADGTNVRLFGTLQDITERKQAEEYLRRFELLSEHSRDIILFMGNQDGRILEANAAAVHAYGYSHDELLTLTVQDLRASDTVGLTAAQMAQADAGGILFETVHRRRDGTTFPVEVSSQGATIGGTRTLISIIRDISERKNAEKALTESEARFRSLFEQSADAHLLLENGVFIDCNLATLQMMRADSKKEILSFPPARLSPEHQPDGRLSSEKAEELIRIALERGSHRFEWLHRRIDGTDFPVEVLLTSISTGDRQVIHAVWRDITERKLAEEALRESEQKFSIIYYKAPFAATLSSLPDGVIIDANEAFERVFGYTRQEVIGKTSLELGINPDMEGRARIAAELQARGSVRDIELLLRTKSGAARVFLINIDLVSISREKYIFQTAQDITERKQIERALQAAHDELEIKVQERTAELSEANALLQALLDNLPDHIYFKDRQCRFIRNSRSQTSLLGLSDPAEVIGKTDFDFFPHAARSYAEEQEVMKSGKPLVDLEEWVVWPDGRETWVLTTKLPLRNSEGQTIGIFGISHDITERKRAEQAIRQLNVDLEKQAEQLQAANKELEAFSYSVSHDLRAPLRAIDGYTRILVEDYESILDNEGKRLCGVISREARRMGQLIDDLLSFSRLGRKEMYASKIEMRTLAVSVLNELLKDEGRERFDIHIANLPVAKGDSSLIRQVWVNLLSNAIKFTSKKERAVIEVGGKTTKDEFIYYVRDNGAGFEMEYANKLFGVFQRLHSESEFSGTGVGLAIVQRIVRRHNGRVWAEGEVEKGATFYFALPRKENLS